MHPRTFLAILPVIALGTLHAQPFAWVAPVTSYAVGKAVAVDAQGNVYSCGNANAQVDFDPGPGQALSPTGSGVNGDIYVVKYDNTGNYLWHYLVGGSSTDIAKNVVVDGNGDVLVSGSYSGFFDWDPGPGVVQPGVGNSDCFVLKVSSAGAFLWLQRITGAGEDQDHGLAVDAANNVYVTGYNSDDVTFSNGDTTLQHQGGVWDGYYAKYGGDGGFRWAKSIAGNGVQRGMSVACSGAHLYLYGSCTGTTVVNGSDTLALPASPWATYVCKTDTAGSVIWLKSQTAMDNMGAEVVRTNGANVYLFASFRGTVDADPGPGILSLVPPSPSYPQTLFVQLDTSGNAVWANQLQGNIHFDCVGDIALDANGGVVVTCAIAQTQDYDPGPGDATITPVQPNDLFIAHYDASGSFLWVRMITTGETFDTASGVAVDAADNVFMTGSYGDSAVFDPGPGGTYHTASSSTAFTVKYGPSLSTGQATAAPAPTLQLMPNPTSGNLTLAGAFERGDALVILDHAGRSVMHLVAQEHLMQLAVGHLKPGVYTLVWTGRSGRASERFVVQ